MLIGIISACAEQTGRHGGGRPRRRDHLRVCGADVAAETHIFAPGGSSPRVRSRPESTAGNEPLPGIISACAEQTMFSCACCRVFSDHLRVCGADAGMSPAVRRRSGSSPRVRSRHLVLGAPGQPRGIISACAEQTSSRWRTCCFCWDHLRVCGADRRVARLRPQMRGSSPRVRSRRRVWRNIRSPRGIISACAEQTTSDCGRRQHTWDHLRVCGADSNALPMPLHAEGSSPRVRSRLRPCAPVGRAWGIISACAEQTRI